MQARNELYKLTLENLKSRLGQLKSDVEKKIEERLKVCNETIVTEKFKPLNGSDKDFLTHLASANSEINKLIYSAYSVKQAKNYIFEHANSWSNITEHQKKEALIDAIQAYQFVLQIADNPDTPIKEEDIAILNVRHQNRPYFIASIVLLVTAVTVLLAFLIVSAFYFPAILANESYLVAGMLTYMFGVNLPAIASFSLSMCSWFEDQGFCNNFTNTVPTFFGKNPATVEQKVDKGAITDTSSASEVVTKLD